MKITTALSLGFLLGASYLPAANAQQINGTPGSPSATITIDGLQLPPPPPKFGGVIQESAKDSKPWWPPRVVPPKGAPNILLIMTDDQGYGVSGTFGGVIPTPAMDRIDVRLRHDPISAEDYTDEPEPLYSQLSLKSFRNRHRFLTRLDTLC